MFNAENMPPIGARVALRLGDDRELTVPMPADGSVGTVMWHGMIFADDVGVCFDAEPDTDHQCDPAWLAAAVGG